MKRYFLLLLIFCIVIFIFSGCQQQSTPLCRVVVGMEISGRHQDVQFTKKYTDTQIIEDVLQCFRIMRSRKKAKPAKENALRDHFIITLYLSDDTTRTYTLAAHRYFKAPKMPWLEIKPEIAARFYSILQKT